MCFISLDYLYLVENRDLSKEEWQTELKNLYDFLNQKEKKSAIDFGNKLKDISPTKDIYELNKTIIADRETLTYQATKNIIKNI